MKIRFFAHHQWMRFVKSFSSMYSNLSYLALLVSRVINFLCVRTGCPNQLYQNKVSPGEYEKSHQSITLMTKIDTFKLWEIYLRMA